MKEPMTATIEPPEPKVLDSADAELDSLEDDEMLGDDIIEDELVEDDDSSVSSVSTGETVS
ncbi:MAG: hypothetical protein F6K09_09065 [Merismopedia sp. SIO2A8]|nr:hypothetical protein [Merismopedia sp. SIO2A8]